MALGASASNVLRLFITQGLRLVAIGLAIGLAVELALGRVFNSLLYGVNATDPFTLSLTIFLLVFAGFFACWIPARRAAKVDPMIALRQE
jgi:putative ABC transport system permease protein